MAKSQPTLDTINWCLKQKPHFFIKLDTRNSFIYNSRVKILGIKAGISFGKRLYIGTGYNQLQPPSPNFNRQVYFTNSDNQKDSVTSTLKMYYFSAQVEYTFYQTRKWELSLPLQFGIGQTYYKYELAGKRKTKDESHNFIYEPAVSVQYKIAKWIGVGADVGFRFMLTEDRKLNQKFNSPTYAFKIMIYYSEIFKSLFPESKWSKKM